MTDEFLQCRDFGHSWKSWHVATVPGGAFEQILMCIRCSSKRSRLLNRSGEQVSKGYQYADGYQLQGFGRMVGHDRDEIRLASIVRLVETPKSKTA